MLGWDGMHWTVTGGEKLALQIGRGGDAQKDGLD